MRRIVKYMSILLGTLILCSCGSPSVICVSETESFSESEGADHAAMADGSESWKKTEAYSRETDGEKRADPTGDSSGNAPPKAVSGGQESSEIYVYVCGAVQKPGVYQLPEGSRVFQAIEAAGGTREDAEDKALNRAQILSDGDQIIVYTAEEIRSGQAELYEPSGVTSGQGGSAGETSRASESGSKVNINTAGPEELQTLPGIGEARAEAIIRYREEHGRFSGIEEIQNISGIKQKAFEKIKDYIEV